MKKKKPSTKKSKKLTKTPKPSVGTISVNIQREDRLKTINNLSEAILACARALNQAPRINISHNVIDVPPNSVGIDIKSPDKVNREVTWQL